MGGPKIGVTPYRWHRNGGCSWEAPWSERDNGHVQRGKEMVGAPMRDMMEPVRSKMIGGPDEDGVATCNLER